MLELEIKRNRLQENKRTIEVLQTEISRLKKAMFDSDNKEYQEMLFNDICWRVKFVARFEQIAEKVMREIQELEVDDSVVGYEYNYPPCDLMEVSDED
jgi:hypothetical protein